MEDPTAEDVSDHNISKKLNPLCICIHPGSEGACYCESSPNVSDHFSVCSCRAPDCKCKMAIPPPTLRTTSLTGPICVCDSHGSICKSTGIRTPTVFNICICGLHGSDCKCITPVVSSEKSDVVLVSARKQHLLSTVSRTECYLKDHRIPELIRFLMTKLIADGSDKPVNYLAKLLDDCMLYRAGFGLPPVLYEPRHLEAVLNSFDPGHRGWLSAGQLRRLYTTLGMNLTNIPDDRICTIELLKKLKLDQEVELFELILAGKVVE